MIETCPVCSNLNPDKFLHVLTPGFKLLGATQSFASRFLIEEGRACDETIRNTSSCRELLEGPQIGMVYRSSAQCADEHAIRSATSS